MHAIIACPCAGGNHGRTNAWQRSEASDMWVRSYCDTLLKQEIEVGALLVGVLSPGWLIAVFEKLSRFEQSADAAF